MYKAENESYINKRIIREKELQICRNNSEVFEVKKNELRMKSGNYTIREELKQKLNKVLKNNENFTKYINEFKSINNYYFSEIKRIEKKDKKLYVIIYLELVLIIIIVGVIGIYYPLNKKYNNKNNIINRNDYNNISSFRRITKKEKNKKLELFDEIEMNEIK